MGALGESALAEGRMERLLERKTVQCQRKFSGYLDKEEEEMLLPHSRH